MVLRFDVRAADQINLARVSDDEFGAIAQTAFHAGRKHRVCIRGVGADDQQHIGVLHRFEGLCTG